MEAFLLSAIAGSQIVSGFANKSAADAQAKIHEQNADTAREQGQEDARRRRYLARKEQGAALAMMGAGGARVGTGSALDVMSDLYTQGALNVRQAKYNAEVRALGQETAAQSARIAGRQALFEGFAGAGATTLLGGFGEGGVFSSAGAKGTGTIASTTPITRGIRSQTMATGASYPIQVSPSGFNPYSG